MYALTGPLCFIPHFPVVVTLLCLLAGQVNGQDDGLVAYWKFDEGKGSVVKDDSGNGQHGTVKDPQWVTGKRGRALNFAKGGYAEISDHPTLRLEDDFTITAWIRKTQASKKGKSMGIVSKSSAGAWDFDLFMSTSRLEHPALYSDAFRAPEGDIELISASPINLDQWHHIAVTRKGPDAKIFVDGTVVGTAMLPESLQKTSRNLFIGYDHDGHFLGAIDEVRIYNRALTDVEIGALETDDTGARMAFTHTVVDRRFGGIREIADIDGDQFPEIIHTYWYESAPLSWYKLQKDGTWKANVVRQNFYPVTDNFDMADMDGDGDPDIIIAKSEKKKSSDPKADNIQIDAVQIVWFENPLPRAATSPWEEHSVGDHYDSNENYVKDIKATDFTGDGKPEIVIRSNLAVSIFHQERSDRWKQIRYIDIHPHEGMDTGDIDCDGDPDIVLNGFWLECPDDPLNERWVEHNMDDKWWNQTGDWTANNCKVYVQDIDADGCADVLLAHSERAGYPVSWYERSKGGGDVWKEHVIHTVDYCHTLQAADMDLDGDIDVIAGEMEKSDDPDQIIVLIQHSAESKWKKQVIANQGIYSGKVADIDKDGDNDIIASRNYDKPPLEIWINMIRK